MVVNGLVVLLPVYLSLWSTLYTSYSKDTITLEDKPGLEFKRRLIKNIKISRNLNPNFFHL